MLTCRFLKSLWYCWPCSSSDKLNKLHLPAHSQNWLIAFLTSRTHSTKYQQIVSTPLSINRSTIQGSGIGLTFYIILESYLKSKSICNVISKYADDTKLLVPQLTDIPLNDEFEAIKRWAINYINIAKT